MKERFDDSEFHSGSRLDVAIAMNEVIEEYQAAGFPRLNLRQIFYQLVSRNVIPNDKKHYGDVSKSGKLGRDRGMIDWDAIEDRSREVVSSPTWASPTERIASAARSYREDLWTGQPFRPQVWCEKEALMGFIEEVAEEFRVPILAVHGYNSVSLMYELGKACAESEETPLVLYLGDHDPSGMQMSEDVERRLSKYARMPIEVRRIALNYRQVRRHRLPPNPVKEADRRAPKYVAEFGPECWELDALPPPVLIALIRDALNGLIDRKLWSAAEKREVRNRRVIERIARGAE